MQKSDHRQGTTSTTAKPIDPSGWPLKFPAKEHCSRCGLCETSFVRNVTQACAFLQNDHLGMSQLNELEVLVHGRSRDVDTLIWSDQTTGGVAEEGRFGVLHEPVKLAQGIGIQEAQWTGVVTSIALSMLETGQVDAVVCIANDDTSSSWSSPKPILAKTKEDILKGRGVKPALAPSLAVLDEIKKDDSIRKLLFCGVGCAVQAFRVIQNDLNLDEVYVLGTNCVDNSPTPEAAENFIREGLKIDDNIPSKNIKGYEFMQDYRVHLKTSNDYITKPYFSLPGSIAEQSIAKSCLACFDYTNALADVVVGYMGAPLVAGKRMDQSDQTLTIRNERGAKMVQAAIDAGKLHVGAIASGKGSHEQLATATVNSDAQVQAMIDPSKVKQQGMPIWLGEIFAFILGSTGPTGINFARYSIDYHILRNYLHVLNEEKIYTSNVEDLPKMLPPYSAAIVKQYLVNDKSFRELSSKIATSRKQPR